MNKQYILAFSQINKQDIALVGGKGANLGELVSSGLPVPDGFCVSTKGFDVFMNTPKTKEVLQELSTVGNDASTAKHVGQKVRKSLKEFEIPDDFVKEFQETIKEFGEEDSYSVRSSATAEDLPDASFAGQQDTYLNVKGADNLLEAVKNCWISLYTDRAILYRNQNNYDHSEVKLSVIVQKMVQSEKSGIMFTADPVSGHRYTVSIDASYGLGEALVSGLVTPDLYHVDSRSLTIVKKEISEKKLAIYSQSSGGTIEKKLQEPESTAQVLDDQQIIELSNLGKKIQSHYKFPQDIEWALVEGKFYILQSRPITSLYPIEGIETGAEILDIYMSFSHQQMMTDVIAPFAVSVYKTLFPLGKKEGEMESELLATVGGRVYANVSQGLRHPLFKKMIFAITSQFDALAPRSMLVAMNRPSFSNGPVASPGFGFIKYVAGLMRRVMNNLWFRNLDGFVQKSNEKINHYLGDVQSKYDHAQSNQETLNILLNIFNAKRDDSAVQLALYWIPSFMAAEIAKRIVPKLAPSGIDEKILEDITLGLPGNVVTVMNQRVGDLADLARGDEEVQEFFAAVNKNPDDFKAHYDQLPKNEFKIAWETFIEEFGSRGPSEIDISAPKWYEDSTPLITMIQGYMQKPARSHITQHELLLENRKFAKQRLLHESGKGIFGPIRKKLVKRCIYVLEHVGGMREHHKFMIIQVLRKSKEALKHVSNNLVESGLLESQSDIWMLSIPELTKVINDRVDMTGLIAQRKKVYTQYQKLNPPLILTSHGEIPVVKYEVENLPEGAIAGNPVSGGVVEGIARVITDPHTQILNKGEILVASFTDPGWTPLFINAGAVVLEIGGAMTHGSVVAREYGIPAVVGITNATKEIQDGTKIRVDGNRGIIEKL